MTTPEDLNEAADFLATGTDPVSGSPSGSISGSLATAAAATFPDTSGTARLQNRPQKKVAIAGAGNVGRSIAAELVENGHEVLLIERETRALKPKTVMGVQWVHGDACEVAVLEEARLQEFDVVVAATGDDKVNLVVSLLAKTEFGVRRVVARVNHPKNEWLYNESWGVDVAVSTPRMLTALVEEAVSVGDLVRLMSFMHGEASLVEVTLDDDSPLAGKRIDEVQLPPDSALVALLREGRVVLPIPEATLEGGDEVLAVTTTPQVEAELARILGGRQIRQSPAETAPAPSEPTVTQ